MNTNVENIVRTIFADTLRVPPSNIRNETMLRVGEISVTQIAFIADRIAGAYRLYPLPVPWNFDVWTTVRDAVDATERMILAKREKAA